MPTKFQSEILKGKDHLIDLGVDGNIILKWVLNKESVGVEWIHMGQCRNWWRALVNALINLRF
jgi:predicted small integral membrane protein